MAVDFQAIIDFHYPAGDPAREILLHHSFQVRDKALAIWEHCPLRDAIDPETVAAGAMLHDIGIRLCHAPDIGCHGQLPYIAHGVAGGKMLRKFDPKLETMARVCERHTGTGLTAAEIRARALPLPELDFLPETPTEKLICLADKFFSKSGDFSEKPLAQVRAQIARFGAANTARFEALLALFAVR